MGDDLQDHRNMVGVVLERLGRLWGDGVPEMLPPLPTMKPNAAIRRLFILGGRGVLPVPSATPRATMSTSPSQLTAPQRAAQIRFIKRLNAWKATQGAALRSEELILSLHKIDASEGKDVSEAIKACDARVASRKAGIEIIKSQIAEARAKLA